MAITNSLVIAPPWIGDAVMTEPLLRRLQARGEQLTVGALPWVAPVYRAMPAVAQVIELPFAHGGLQFKARRALAAQLQDRFDVAYVLPNSLKSALLPLLAGIPKRVGYLGEARIGLLTHRLKNPPKDRRPPMVAFYSALSGDTDVLSDRPQLQLPAERIAATLQILGLDGIAYTVFAPGAEFGIQEEVMDTYIKSCAGYCVATYLLGIGDRHLDNIMIRADGHLFHIDFGFILGKDPKPMPAPMRLTAEMIDGMGGPNHANYSLFKSYCCQAYNILRRHATLTTTLVALMRDAGINDLDSMATVGKMHDKYRVDIDDEAADAVLLSIIDDSVGRLFPQFLEVLHKIRVAFR